MAALGTMRPPTPGIPPVCTERKAVQDRCVNGRWDTKHSSSVRSCPACQAGASQGACQRPTAAAAQKCASAAKPACTQLAQWAGARLRATLHRNACATRAHLVAAGGDAAHGHAGGRHAGHGHLYRGERGQQTVGRAVAGTGARAVRVQAALGCRAGCADATAQQQSKQKLQGGAGPCQRVQSSVASQQPSHLVDADVGGRTHVLACS